MTPNKATLDALRIDRAQSPRGGIPIVLALLALILAATAGGLAWWFARTRPVMVRTAAAQQVATTGGRTLLNASGYVTARRAATVSSKVTGKVVEVMVEEGKKVEAGQLLARLDSSNVQASVRLAEAQAESARKALGETRASLEQAQRDLNRITQLAATKDVSQSELDRAETEAKLLTARLEKQQAEVAVAERELAIWKQQLEDNEIRAPFSGVVTSKNAQPGEMISPLSVGGFTRTGICTIVDMSSLEIEVDVNESYINRVEPGQRVQATLDAYPGWSIPALVTAIIPTADRQKATVKVRVGFEKLDPRILPDMSVKVAFQAPAGGEVGAGSRAVTVPKAAVRQSDGKTVVWVVREGRLERRAVTVGEEIGDNVRITAGLSGGERVATEGSAELVEGARVREGE